MRLNRINLDREEEENEDNDVKEEEEDEVEDEEKGHKKEEQEEVEAEGGEEDEGEDNEEKEDNQEENDYDDIHNGKMMGKAAFKPKIPEMFCVPPSNFAGASNVTTLFGLVNVSFIPPPKINGSIFCKSSFLPIKQLGFPIV